jgi:hypothetical protein
MTEAEWLACEDPEGMVAHLGDRISTRKARLFGCCHRHRVWPYLVDERSQKALEVSERFADGLATKEELATACSEGFTAMQEISDVFGPDDYAYQTAASLMWAVAAEPARNLHAGLRADDMHVVVGYVRDIFGNPFRPVTFLPEWHTSTVISLAQQMYDSRDFSAMPILGDALMDAGCFDEAIQTHCRGPGPHVRGCHIVDACLGKS